MITPSFAFCHTVTIEKWIERGISGDVYDAPTTVKCRVNFKKSRSRSSTSDSVRAVSGTVFFDKSVSIGTHDRLTFNGENFEIIGVQSAYNLDGTINHIEAEIA